MTSVDKLKQWYATLTIETLPDIYLFYAADASFKDPFNEVRGIAAIEQIFSHMFQTTEHPSFSFIDTIQQGNQAFLSWQFKFGLNGKEYEVKGGTHLYLDDAGLITMHRDYWDAAEELWQKLPVLGTLVRWLRRKFSAQAQR
jgi:ketosteroid isomerase-like protein